MTARLRTVPPVAAVTQAAAPPVPEEGAPYVDTQRPRRMRGPDPRQPHALRQHGRAAEAFHRRPRRRMGERHAGRQARGGVHLDRDHARRPGSDAAVDDVAAAAPRLRGRRHSVHRAGADMPRAAAARPTARATSPACRTIRSPSDDEAQLARALGRRIAQLAAKVAHDALSVAHRAGAWRCSALSVLFVALVPRRPPPPGARWLVFALPPLLLLVGVLRGARKRRVLGRRARRCSGSPTA